MTTSSNASKKRWTSLLEPLASSAILWTSSFLLSPNLPPSSTGLDAHTVLSDNYTHRQVCQGENQQAPGSSPAERAPISPANCGVLLLRSPVFLAIAVCSDIDPCCIYAPKDACYRRPRQEDRGHVRAAFG